MNKNTKTYQMTMELIRVLYRLARETATARAPSRRPSLCTERGFFHRSTNKMCYVCSLSDLRCHTGESNSQRGITMPSIIYGNCDRKTEEVLEYFAEVEDDDPRLTLILGYARIHTAIRDLIDQHTARQTNGRKPNLFKTQISSLRRAGVFDAGYYEYLRLYARVRNRIAHHVTSRTTLAEEPYLSDVLRMHELSSVVQVWREPISPVDDMGRSVFALAIAGCLVIELGEDGERKGFDSLCGRLSNG